MAHRTLLFFILLSSPLLTLADTATRQHTGQPAPDFSLKDLQGNTHSIKQWRGKVVVLNFWASWCGPCRKEIPLFNQLQKEYGEDDVQFIGLAVDTLEAVKKFIEIVPIDYPVLIGDMEALKLVSAYGNSHGSLPYTVLIDRNGNIAAIASGILTREYASRAIERLL